MGEGLLGLNGAPEEEARRLLAACCATKRWVDGMIAARPFANVDAVLRRADALWHNVERAEVLEAMSRHPRIGDAKKASATEASEQAGATSAVDAIKTGLADGNAAYEERFGHIYLVCASGKSGEELLEILRDRLRNDPATELRVAASEQGKITQLRLVKLVGGA